MSGARQSKPKRPNLILGTIENYAFYEIEPFLATLRETGFDGRLCMLCGPNISSRTIRRIRASGAEVIPYRPKFPFVQDPHPDAPRSLPEPIHIYNYRHFLYYDYLLKHGGEFENVMLTDVRDVVFQRDPFEFPIAGKLHVAMENRGIPVGACPYTSSWMLAGYGAKVLERFRDDELSCAGTTIGPAPLVLRYLELMLEQIALMKDAYNCADQAAHNVLLHEGRLGRVAKSYNFEGPILTVGSEPRYRLDDHHRLANRDGSVIAVIHQYDRHPALARRIDRHVRPNAARRSIAWFVHLWRRIGRRIDRLHSIVRGHPAAATS